MENLLHACREQKVSKQTCWNLYPIVSFRVDYKSNTAGGWVAYYSYKINRITAAN